MQEHREYGLSPREREVLRLSCEGWTDQQIAGKLSIADATVRTYVSRLLAKTGAANRTQLGSLAAGGVNGMTGRPADRQTGNESVVPVARSL